MERRGRCSAVYQDRKVEGDSSPGWQGRFAVSKQLGHSRVACGGEPSSASGSRLANVIRFHATWGFLRLGGESQHERFRIAAVRTCRLRRVGV